MTETYQIFIRPGFTGDGEGREFIHRVMKRIKYKPVLADDKDGWLDYAMYPCATKVEVKKVIEDIIRSRQQLWADKKDLFITIDDDTRQFYPSGGFNTKLNPSESDWEGFVLVEIESGTKKHYSRSSALNPAHKKHPEKTKAIDMNAFSTGQINGEEVNDS